MPPIVLPTRETSRGLTADAEALLVQINAAFDEVHATLEALPAPYNPAPLAARVTALEDAPAPGPTLTGLRVANGLLFAEMSDGTSHQVQLPTTATQPVAYPQLITGMVRPGSIPVAYSGSAPVLQITPSWFNGVLTTGNPNFIDWNTDQSVTLNGRYVGADWNSGTTQIIKPKRGQGRWSWVASSTNANAVLAMFTYASENNADGVGNGVELDFEYVLRNGVKGWLLTVHMPIAGVSNRASMSAPFVPFSDADFATPKLFEIDHNDTRTEWYIDGALVGTVTRAAIQAQTPDVMWMTTAVMEQFSSVERHGSWAGWTNYTTASMRVWGVKSPDAPVVAAPAPIDGVVVIGASLMEFMFGKDLATPNADASTMLANAGYDIPVYGYATPGYRLASADSDYTAARAAHPNALIISHYGGNNVSDSRPYPGGQTTFNTGLSDLLTAAQGDDRFYPMAITFRDYDDTTFQNPDNGSRPYNDNLLIPWMTEHFPHAVTSYGRPVFDNYRRVLQDFETWLSGDNVHLNSTGYAGFKPWIIARIADVLSGTEPAEITERLYVAPPAPTGDQFFTDFSTQSAGPLAAPWEHISTQPARFSFGTALGQTVLQQADAATGDTGALLTALSGDAIELYSEGQTSNNNSSSLEWIIASTGYTSTEGLYRIDINPATNVLRLRKRTGGGHGSVATATLTQDIVINETVSIRARHDAGRVRVRLWITGTAEPTTWQIDYTDAAPFIGPFRVGAYSTADRSRPIYLKFGVAVAGGTAPTAAVGQGQTTQSVTMTAGEQESIDGSQPVTNIS